MPERRFTGCRTKNKRSENRRNMGPKDKERATVRSTRFLIALSNMGPETLEDHQAENEPMQDSSDRRVLSRLQVR